MNRQSIWFRAREVQGRPLDYFRAVRAALCLGIPMIIGWSLGELSAGMIAALAAYLVCFADDIGGPLRDRALAIVWCAGVTTLMFLVGMTLAESSIATVVLVTVSAFGWALTSGIHPTVSVVGAMGTTAALFGSETATPSPLAQTGWFVVGAALVLVVTVTTWPWFRGQDLRAQVRYAQRLSEDIAQRAITAPQEDFEKLRGTALAGVDSARFRVLRSAMRPQDRIILLAEIRRAERRIKVATAVRSLPPDDQRRQLGAQALDGPKFGDSADSLSDGGDHDPRNHAPDRTPWLTTWRLHLGRSSDGWRYGTQFALVTLIGLLLELVSRFPHGGWIPLTSWRILRPTYVVTQTRAVQRVGGTVLGGLAAALLLWWLAGAWLIFALLISAAGCFLVRPRNYGLYTLLATLVILALLAVGDDNGWGIALARIGATVVGAILALAAARWLLPRWTQEQISDSLARAAMEVGRYAREVARGYSGHYDEPAVVEGRRDCDSSTAKANNLFDQYEHEPNADPSMREVCRRAQNVINDGRSAVMLAAHDLAVQLAAAPPDASRATTTETQFVHHLAQLADAMNVLSNRLADLQHNRTGTETEIDLVREAAQAVADRVVTVTHARSTQVWRLRRTE